MNFENLSIEEVDALSIKLGNQVRDICDKAVVEANEILNSHGLSAIMQIVIDETNKINELRDKHKNHKDNKIESKKKRGRPKKSVNL